MFHYVQCIKKSSQDSQNDTAWSKAILKSRNNNWTYITIANTNLDTVNNSSTQPVKFKNAKPHTSPNDINIRFTA